MDRRSHVSSPQPILRIKAKLGSGSAGNVYYALTEANQPVALKVYDDPTVAKNEQRAHARLGSENLFIATTFGLVRSGEQIQTINQTSDENLGILETDALLFPVEIAQGNLVHQLRQRGSKGFAEEVAMKVAYEVLQALEYAHRKGVAHCDVKPENVLVGLNGHIRVCDWSSALVASIEKNTSSWNFFCKHLRGTKMYAPPEVIIHKTVSEGMLIAAKPWDTTLGDVWSTGITLYVMTVGHPPFHYAHPRDPWFASFVRQTHQDDDVAELILHRHSESLEKDDCYPSRAQNTSVDVSQELFSWPPTMSPSLLSLLSKMLRVKPEKRCTVTEALQELKCMNSAPVGDASGTEESAADVEKSDQIPVS